MRKLIVGIVTVFLLVGCSSTATVKESSTEEETKKITITNNAPLVATEASMSDYKWIGNEVGDFEETSLKETIRLFDEKGSGVVYYGYVGCPWCERAVVELNKVMLKYDVPAYYVDAAVSPNHDDYLNLTNNFGDILDTDEETGEKEMYVPFVVGIKNGKVVGYHVALVDGFEIQSEDSQMSDAQKEELQKIYEDIYLKVAD